MRDGVVERSSLPLVLGVNFGIVEQKQSEQGRIRSENGDVHCCSVVLECKLASLRGSAYFINNSARIEAVSEKEVDLLNVEVLHCFLSHFRRERYQAFGVLTFHSSCSFAGRRSKR